MYHVSVTALSVLHVVTNLIFKVTLYRRFYYHSHFRDEEREAHRCLVIHPRTIAGRTVEAGFEPKPFGSPVYAIHH